MCDEHAPQLPMCYGDRASQDRRDFLRTAALAAPALAAPALAAPALATSQATAAQPSPAAPAASAQVAAMPQIRLGKHMVSRLILGCHNIDGGSHMSPFLDREMHAYYTPERAVQTLIHCQQLGINAWQGHERGTLLGIYNRFRKAGGQMHLIGLTASDEDLKPFTKIDGLIAMGHHGEVTDVLFKQGKLDVMHDRLKRIRDAGFLVGVSTHMPEVVDAVESKGWDVDYFQTCVYQRHRDEATLARLLGDVPLPVGEVYLKGDPGRMFRAIRQTRRPCLAFKILAAGRRHDVERAFQETFAGIKPTDAVIVGIYDRYNDQAAQNAAFARKYGALPRAGVAAS